MITLLSNDPIKTFCLYSPNKACDERERAQDLAKLMKAEHNEILFELHFSERRALYYFGSI
jgi:hypothetical protein